MIMMPPLEMSMPPTRGDYDATSWDEYAPTRDDYDSLDEYAPTRDDYDSLDEYAPY